MKTSHFFSFSLLVGALAILPQCDWLKSTGCCGTQHTSNTHAANGTSTHEHLGNSSEVLVTMYDNKVPKITVDSFNEYVEGLCQVQPQYKQILDLMPDARKQVLEAMAGELAIEEYIKVNNIDQSPEYQKDLANILKLVKRQLAMQYFQKHHPVSVSKDEVRRWYEENKNKTQELIVVQGGVKADGVIFTNKADAKAFYDKVKDTRVDFHKAAQEAGLSVKKFGLVSDQSYDVEAPIRTKLLALTRTPVVELIDLDTNNAAVVKALSKETTQYAPFDQVEAGIENWLKQQKAQEEIMKQIEKLKKDLNVTINSEYFDKQRGAESENAFDQEDDLKEVHAPSAMQGA
jgi:PPIC-type PPIASE domain